MLSRRRRRGRSGRRRGSAGRRESYALGPGLRRRRYLLVRIGGRGRGGWGSGRRGAFRRGFEARRSGRGRPGQLQRDLSHPEGDERLLAQPREVLLDLLVSAGLAPAALGLGPGVLVG